MLLFLIPIADLVANSWPLQPGEITWRFATGASFSTTMFALLMGSLLGTSLAAARRDRLTLLGLALLHGLCGVLFLAIALDFSLSLLQMSPVLSPEARGGLLVAGAFTILKFVGTATLLVWLAVEAWRSFQNRPDTPPEELPLVIPAGGYR